jgi:hypothetical protein
MSGMVSATRAPLRPKQQLERAQLGALGQMKCLAKAEQAVTSAFLVAFVLAGVLAVCADAGTALADSQIAVYGGWNDSLDSDITLRQPNGTNMTLHDIPWDGVSFEAPPYWGIRGAFRARGTASRSGPQTKLEIHSR